MLRILGRYIFREIFSSAILGTLLATFILFLRGADPIFELLVKSNGANYRIVLEMFALALPGVLPYTIPFGVLVGILIGLGRMASDGEIIAMRAAGISSQRVIAPVLLFALLGGGFGAYTTLRLTPASIRRYTQLVNQLEETQLSADITPNVFVENFPNTILYVGNVRPGEPALWGPVFVADIGEPEKRATGLRDQSTGPMITVADHAIAVPDVTNNRIQLSLRNYSTHEMGKDQTSRDTSAPTGQQALNASPPTQTQLRSIGMSTHELRVYPRDKPDWIETQIELHRRFTLPVACIMLAMVGIPLGIATRKGGKSAGYVNAIFVAFFCYYLAFASLTGLARGKNFPAVLWLPNCAFFLAGSVLLGRMERAGDSSFVENLRARWADFLDKVKARLAPKSASRLGGWRLPLLPQLVDTYILSNFVFYVFLVLASFVSLILVYDFFELINDMLRNHISLREMFTYLFFLTPRLIYETLPVSVLVGVLAALGVMSKHNEIIAFKACGVSLYRLAAPILIGSGLLAGGLFAFDYYYVAPANRIQDALRDHIKGRQTQTYLRPDRTWRMGSDGSRIFYYRFFDNSGDDSVMHEAYVFELDRKSFRLTRQIFAKQARWSRQLKTWVFEDGWTCGYEGAFCTPATYAVFRTRSFDELTEPPDYFRNEALKDEQMNFLQLENYIKELRQSGFEGTVKLQVRLFRKFSLPLFALIMAMIAIPFGFLVGNRGAMTGIGISLGIAACYLAIGTLFEKLGDASLLQPAVAAWAPDVVFALAGMYLLLRMRS
ncbi:MAG TPA: LptF/LptG family permease [Candidatus Acidoferrales bacterium]|nr:LptF/LptG family permease [Candidatus Acidoferrales bacterium]